MACATGDETALRTGRREEGHVARHHDHGEGAPEVEGREVVLDPFDARCTRPRGLEHRVVGVDSDYLDPPAASPRRASLDRDAAGPAAGIEDTRRRERHDECRFAVHVDAVGGKSIEASLVRVAFPGHERILRVVGAPVEDPFDDSRAPAGHAAVVVAERLLGRCV